MSKRTKKSNRARAFSQRSDSPTSSQSLQNAAAVPADQANLPEYEYVSKDLRHVTILAAAMFALLIALSFFIG